MAGWATAAKPDANPTVKIMTQNMDDGTDQTYIIAALAFNALPLPDAVDLTYSELQASNFEGRAGLMAAKIADEKPQLVALQEAALWRYRLVPRHRDDRPLRQARPASQALKAAGVPYDVVAVNRLSDLALPGGSAVGALRFTDRNAVLVRSDLRPPGFHLSNVHARTFDAAFPFTVSEDLTLTIPAGWISADVHMGNKQFRFVTTHLESPLKDIPEATIVQVAQAQELIHALRNLTIPVVICGDFNSDAQSRRLVVEDTPDVRPLRDGRLHGRPGRRRPTHGRSRVHVADLPGGSLLPRLPSSYSPTHPSRSSASTFSSRRAWTVDGAELVQPRTGGPVATPRAAFRVRPRRRDRGLPPMTIC